MVQSSISYCPDNPQRFVEILVDFMQSSAPAPADEQKWRERLRTGTAAR